LNFEQAKKGAPFRPGCINSVLLQTLKNSNYGNLSDELEGFLWRKVHLGEARPGLSGNPFLHALRLY